MSTDYTPHEHDPANDYNYARPCCLAAVLHHVADRIATVDERHRMSFHLGFQPDHSGGDEAVEATVDAVGMAICGTAGKTRPMSGGTYHHDVNGKFERLAAHVAAYGAVTPPEKREAEREVARLRAEVAELRRLHGEIESGEVA